MVYYIPTGYGRVSASTLKDAYRDGAAILLGLYKQTHGNIHRLVPEYTLSHGLPIYDTATGKATSHWVRFDDGETPWHGYEEVSYNKAYGVATKSKSFPKNWL